MAKKEETLHIDAWLLLKKVEKVQFAPDLVVKRAALPIMFVPEIFLSSKIIGDQNSFDKTTFCDNHRYGINDTIRKKSCVFFTYVHPLHRGIRCGNNGYGLFCRTMKITNS